MEQGVLDPVGLGDHELGNGKSPMWSATLTAMGIPEAILSPRDKALLMRALFLNPMALIQDHNGGSVTEITRDPTALHDMLKLTDAEIREQGLRFKITFSASDIEEGRRLWSLGVEDARLEWQRTLEKTAYEKELNQAEQQEIKNWAEKIARDREQQARLQYIAAQGTNY